MWRGFSDLAPKPLYYVDSVDYVVTRTQFSRTATLRYADALLRYVTYRCRRYCTTLVRLRSTACALALRFESYAQAHRFTLKRKAQKGGFSPPSRKAYPPKAKKKKQALRACDMPSALILYFFLLFNVTVNSRKKFS